MINLRYHIVSLVAVFLALTVGVIAGSTVIDQALVRDLRRQRNVDAATKTELRQEVASLRRELDLWDAFGASTIGPRMKGVVAGRSVFLITLPGTPSSLTDDVGRALTDGGATTTGRLGFTARWHLKDPAARADLSDLLSVTTDDAGELLAAGAGAIAERLVAPADPRRDTDLLKRLDEAGFLELADVDARAFPARGSLMVLVSSVSEDPVPDDGFFEEFLRRTAPTLPSAVAGALGDGYRLTEAVRGDADLSLAVASVDHADTAPGALALVFALRDVVEGRPASHYGVRRGADRIAPAP